MAFQTVFKRYELKFLLSKEQRERIMKCIEPYIRPDEYGHSVIRNLYFDDERFRLIRRSMEKPEYKEKLRIRAYETVAPGSPVFVELKKKYQKEVFKRRVALPEADAMNWLCGKAACPLDTQITREIAYFLSFYQNLRPAVFLSYEREAFYDRAGRDFRVTFDERVLYRCRDLSLTCQPGGIPLLQEDQVLMEIKCAGGIPLWMVQVLSEEQLYKTSFSKYGTAYADIMKPMVKEILLHA